MVNDYEKKNNETCNKIKENNEQMCNEIKKTIKESNEKQNKLSFADTAKKHNVLPELKNKYH